MTDVNSVSLGMLQATELDYVRDMVRTIKATEAAHNLHVATVTAYNQYAAFLARRYGMTERDGFDLETGVIQRDAASNAVEAEKAD